MIAARNMTYVGVAVLTMLAVHTTESIANEAASTAPGRESVCVAPAVKPDLVLITVVDRTQVRLAAFNARLLDVVSQAAMRPRTRLVTWAFGGSRPMPALVADLTTPALLPKRSHSISSLIETAMKPSGADDDLQKCVAAMAGNVRNQYIEQLKQELAHFDGGKDGSSPITLAISEAVAPFSAEAKAGQLRILVITDGYEHSGRESSRVSFYPSIDGRYPSPEEAVAKTGVFPGSWQGARLTMSGIGMAADPDVAAVAALVRIWSAIAIARGAVVDQLTLSVPQRLSEPRDQ